MYFLVMSRKTTSNNGGFGAHVMELRMRKGITQVELTRAVGVTKYIVSFVRSCIEME
jgi:DNA-binding XRE family transcriptional regulator